MRKLAAGSIATSLVREEEGACLGAIAGSVGELVSLGHDDFGLAISEIWNGLMLMEQEQGRMKVKGGDGDGQVGFGFLMATDTSKKFRLTGSRSFNTMTMYKISTRHPTSSSWPHGISFSRRHER